MRRINCLLSFTCFYFLILLQLKGQEITREKQIRLDLRTAMGGTAASYMEAVHFTVFDSDPTAIFGNIDQLEITENHYIILDRDTKSVLIFDKQGKFHARIAALKINPQRPNFYSFSYDRATKTITINFKTEVCYFDINGKLLERRKLGFLSYLGTEQPLGTGYSGNYYFSPQVQYKKKDSLAYELMVVKDGLVRKKYLPYHTSITTDDSQSGQATMDFTRDSQSSDNLNFTREYDYNVYRFTKDTLNVAYKFMFPLNVSLPNNFRSDTSYNGKRSRLISSNKSLIYKLSSFYKAGDQLLFRTLSADFSNYSYVYGLQSSKLLCLNKVVSDLSTYYLPVTDSEVGGLDFINHGILASDGSYFYTSYSSLVLFRQMQATRSKRVKYPEELKKYFSKKDNQKGNPILVQFKLKKDLN